MKKKMREVIFLDIDGVLNCCTTRNRHRGMIFVDDDKIELLSKIVDATDAKIVLTSTWRLGQLHPDNACFLTDFIHLRDALGQHSVFIADVTQDLGNRGQEISEWIESHEIGNFVILDDEIDMIENFPLCRNHIVETSFLEGLTPELAEQAIEILRGGLE